jgi:hypothetical protein
MADDDLQKAIEKGKQSQEKRVRMAAEEAAAEAKKCTWATTLTCSSYRKLTA